MSKPEVEIGADGVQKMMGSAALSGPWMIPLLVGLREQRLEINFVHLGRLPWEEVLSRIQQGKLPRPLWKLDTADKRARWDRKAVGCPHASEIDRFHAHCLDPGTGSCGGST